MKIATSTAALFALQVIACGSEDASGPTTSGATFNPPAALEGYTRLVSPSVPNVGPGGDVTYCQYVMPPFDHDVDILDVRGYQSKAGHHAVAFSYADDGKLAIGDSVPCMGTEVTSGAEADARMGAFLGGIAGETASGESATALPEGVAFRLKQGNGVLLNVHYLNTTSETIAGKAVVDIKFAEVDPQRKVAAMFINLNTGFNVSPAGRTESSANCVAQSDVQLLMMSNHMHEFGVSAATEVMRTGSAAFDDVHSDPKWTYEMQFNPVYSRWSVATPFTIHAGDTIRTTCRWENPLSESLAFPREMCVGIGFALASGENPTAPACFNGAWVPEFG
jgi:hypothetical protein